MEKKELRRKKMKKEEELEMEVEELKELIESKERSSFRIKYKSPLVQ